MTVPLHWKHPGQLCSHSFSPTPSVTSNARTVYLFNCGYMWILFSITPFYHFPNCVSAAEFELSELYMDAHTCSYCDLLYT